MVFRRTVSTFTLTFFICTSTLSYALEKVADVSDTDGYVKVIGGSGRTKRDLGYGGVGGGVMSKRPRQFVGKREAGVPSSPIDDSEDAEVFSDYDGDLLEYALNGDGLLNDFLEFLDSDFLKAKLAGRFLTNEELKTVADELLAEELPSPLASQRLAKRPRQFVGKRGGDLDLGVAMEKRPRQFVGKRARQFIGKRARQFIGKRPRQFVGKRAEDELLAYLADQRPYFGALSKRPRQFVGKRESDFDVAKRPRQFVGKRAAFPGLVNDDSSDSALIFAKRPRQFVGKRSDNEISKRPRQFVGKRGDDDMAMAKRPRQFVGKRGSEVGDVRDVLDMAKRPRQFVGRR